MYEKKQYRPKKNYQNKGKGGSFKKSGGYKTPYEMNFFCFDIGDFRAMDSITVYDPKTKSRVKGVVVETDKLSREIKFNTSDQNGLTTSINNILFLKEYDKDWLV